MKRLAQFMTREWGSLWLFFFCIPAIFKNIRAGYGGHYEMFIEASRVLWNGGNPHEKLYSTGYFNYHASAGLYFYSFFGLFPNKVGMFLYMSLTLTLAFFGARFLSRVFELSDRQRNLFFFLASSELLGTTLNMRLELFIVGCLFFCIGFLIQQKYHFSAWILAFPSVFKIQALALAGLLGIQSLWNLKKNWLLHFSTAFLVIFLSPSLVLGFQEALHVNTQMSERFSTHIPEVFHSMIHIFTFWDFIFGTHTSLQEATFVSAIVALTFALRIFWLSWKKTPANQTISEAIALSCVFMASFSVMGQSAAYSLILPLLMIAIRDQQKSRWVQVGIWGSWILISVLSSDLVPRELRTILFNSAIKALGPIWLCAFWMYGTRITSKAALR